MQNRPALGSGTADTPLSRAGRLPVSRVATLGEPLSPFPVQGKELRLRQAEARRAEEVTIWGLLFFAAFPESLRPMAADRFGAAAAGIAGVTLRWRGVVPCSRAVRGLASDFGDFRGRACSRVSSGCACGTKQV
jgi:hypothetical protein